MAKFRHKNMVVKGRPVSLKEEDKTPEEDSSPGWLQFTKRHAASIFIVVVFIVPNLSAIAWPYVMTLWTSGNSLEAATENITSSADDGGGGGTEQGSVGALHQAAPLRKEFSVNYADVMRVRQENMKRYGYEYSVFGIDKRANLSLEEFYDVYDGKWPVVVTDVIPKWPASNWSRDFFLQNYGQERVTMKAVDHLLDSAIQDLLPLFNDLDLEDDLDMSNQSSLDKAVSLALPLELFYKNTHKAYPHSWTYIEDELFIPMRPQLKQDIGECVYLNEDFYSLFPSEVRPWNSMLLWGTQYSRSSLHMDPYNWTGTNAVIQGRKRWRLYPPGQDQFLYVMPGRKSGFPLDSTKYNSPIDAYEPNKDKYPLFKKATALEFDQLPGEILFIPTGWFHQAYNMEETIAVSSQMMNRNNYRIVLEEILKVNDIKRSELPKNIDTMSPQDQVRAIMRMLPAELLQRGKAVTDDIINQVKNGGEKNSIPDNLK